MQFEKTPYDNEVLEGDGFYISYNPRPCAGMHLFMSDKSGPETAIVFIDGPGGRERYLILNGDFRSEYEAAADGGLEACKRVYESHITHKSSWTTPQEEEDERPNETHETDRG